MAVKRIKVKPNPEKTVNGKPLVVQNSFAYRPFRTEGEEVLDCPKIQNLLHDGELVMCDEKTPAPAKGPEEPLHQAKSQETHQSKKRASRQAKKITVDSGDSDT